ncbi:unnamed protein product, partial [Meganyctiphanes norvegica]
MYITQEDRFKMNYQKALDIGQAILVIVVRVILGNISVKERFNALSNKEKKKLNFGKNQIKHIQDGMDLAKMDISMLDLITRAFCGLGDKGHSFAYKDNPYLTFISAVDQYYLIFIRTMTTYPNVLNIDDTLFACTASFGICSVIAKKCVSTKPFNPLGGNTLNDLLKKLKETRNDFAHQRQNMTLDKAKLTTKLTEMGALYTSILEELKTNYCNPTQITFIDKEIKVTDAQLLLLHKTLDDHIIEETNNLVKAAAEMTKSSEQAAAMMTKSSVSVDQAVNQASADLNRTMEHGKTILEENLNQAAENIKHQVTYTLNESALNVNANYIHAQEELDKTLKKIAEIIPDAATMTSSLNAESQITALTAQFEMAKLDHERELLTLKEEKNVGECKIEGLLAQLEMAKLDHERELQTLKAEKNVGDSKIEELLAQLQENEIVYNTELTTLSLNIEDSKKDAARLLQELTEAKNKIRHVTELLDSA